MCKLIECPIINLTDLLKVWLFESVADGYPDRGLDLQMLPKSQIYINSFYMHVAIN